MENLKNNMDFFEDLINCKEDVLIYDDYNVLKANNLDVSSLDITGEETKDLINNKNCKFSQTKGFTYIKGNKIFIDIYKLICPNKKSKKVLYNVMNLRRIICENGYCYEE